MDLHGLALEIAAVKHIRILRLPVGHSSSPAAVPLKAGARAVLAALEAAVSGSADGIPFSSSSFFLSKGLFCKGPGAGLLILGRGAPPAWIAMVFLLAPGSCHFLLPAAHILDVGRQKGRQGRLLVKVVPSLLLCLCEGKPYLCRKAAPLCKDLFQDPPHFL